MTRYETQTLIHLPKLDIPKQYSCDNVNNNEPILLITDVPISGPELWKNILIRFKYAPAYMVDCSMCLMILDMCQNERVISKNMFKNSVKIYMFGGKIGMMVEYTQSITSADMSITHFPAM